MKSTKLIRLVAFCAATFFMSSSFAQSPAMEMSNPMAPSAQADSFEGGATNLDFFPGFLGALNFASNSGWGMSEGMGNSAGSSFIMLVLNIDASNSTGSTFNFNFYNFIPGSGPGDIPAVPEAPTALLLGSGLLMLLGLRKAKLIGKKKA